MADSIDNLLIVDTETDGIDEAQDHVIEIGVVLWSVSSGVVLSAWSDLVVHDSNAAESVNEIPVEALAKGLDYDSALAILRGYVARADVIVAHNGEFDRRFLPELGKEWLCTMEDVQWPKQSKTGDLIRTAILNGVAVTDAHRALGDCQLIARTFERVREKYGVERVREMIALAMRPKGLFRAVVPFTRKDEAKEAHFRWKNENGRKGWFRRMAREDISKLTFDVIEVVDPTVARKTVMGEPAPVLPISRASKARTDVPKPKPRAPFAAPKVDEVADSDLSTEQELSHPVYFPGFLHESVGYVAPPIHAWIKGGILKLPWGVQAVLLELIQVTMAREGQKPAVPYQKGARIFFQLSSVLQSDSALCRTLNEQGKAFEVLIEPVMGRTSKDEPIWRYTTFAILSSTAISVPKSKPQATAALVESAETRAAKAELKGKLSEHPLVKEAQEILHATIVDVVLPPKDL